LITHEGAGPDKVRGSGDPKRKKRLRGLPGKDREKLKRTFRDNKKRQPIGHKINGEIEGNSDEKCDRKE